MKNTACTSIKNLAFQNNWPFADCKNLSLPEESHKVLPISEARLPLGIKLYSPQGVVVGPSKPVLSHHFAPNSYKEEKFDKLSEIKSLGDQEKEESESRAVDTPLYPVGRRGNRNGSQTPLSRFAATPSSLAKRNIQNGSMTPQIKKSHAHLNADPDISAFERKGTLPVPKKLI